jgi:hypothetical protein
MLWCAIALERDSIDKIKNTTSKTLYMKTLNLFAAVTVGLALLTGCQKSEEKAAEGSSQPAAPSAPAAPAPAPAPQAAPAPAK